MRMIKLTDATTVPIEPAKWTRFPVWLDADRVVSLSPGLQEQNYGGQYFTVDGTKIDLEGGYSLRVQEPVEAVAEMLGWQSDPT